MAVVRGQGKVEEGGVRKGRSVATNLQTSKSKMLWSAMTQYFDHISVICHTSQKERRTLNAKK